MKNEGIAIRFKHWSTSRYRLPVAKVESPVPYKKGRKFSLEILKRTPKETKIPFCRRGLK